MEYYPPGGLVSATDTNAVHKDGSDTMTGPLNLGSGSKIICAASGTPGSTNYEIVRTAGNTFFINAPNTGDIELGNAGSGKLNIGSAGVRLLGTGGAGHLVFQTSSGGALSTRALTPSDLPVRRRLETVLTGSHPLLASTWTRLKTDAPSVNTLPLTISGTGNVTFTATEDIVLAFRIGIFAPDAGGNCWISAYINGSIYTRSAAGQFSVGHTWSEVVRLASGQTLEFYAYAISGGNTDASYPEIAKIHIFEIGR